MKRVLLAGAALIAIAGSANAQGYGYGGYGTGSNPSHVHVDSYTRRDGTFVGAHERSAPDHTQYNNYTTNGNVNPYTGTIGTRSPRY